MNEWLKHHGEKIGQIYTSTDLVSAFVLDCCNQRKFENIRSNQIIIPDGCWLMYVGFAIERYSACSVNLQDVTLVYFTLMKIREQATFPDVHSLSPGAGLCRILYGSYDISSDLFFARLKAISP